MKNSLDLSFEVVEREAGVQNSAGCKTGGRSTCCTTYCTRDCNIVNSEESMDAWDNYLQLNTGVLQY